MNLSRDVAYFALACTEDPEVAAQMADLLGDAVATGAQATPIVAFPPRWVLAKQKGAVAIARFAIRHCDDPDTLATIAAKATRQGVRHALALNPHLPDAAAAALEVLATSPNEWQLRQYLAARTSAAATAPDTLANYAARAASDPSLWGPAHRQAILDLLRTSEGSTDAADAILRATVAAGHSWLVARYLRESFEHGGSREVFFSELGKTPAGPLTYLDLLSAKAQSSVLTTFVSSMLECGQNETPIGVDLAERIVAGVPTSELPASQRVFFRRPVVFTPDAVDVLLDHDEWCAYLVRHELTDAQLIRVATTLSPERRLQLVETAGTTRDRVVLLLEQVPAATPIAHHETVEAILNVVTTSADGIVDPLFAQLVARATPEMVRNYIGLRWWVNGHPVIPEAATFVALVDRVRDSLEQGAPLAVDGGQLYATAIVDYLPLLVDEVPGFAREHLDHPAIRTYVFAQLRATGAPLDLALSQFDSSAKVGLRALCATLSRMARL